MVGPRLSFSIYTSVRTLETRVDRWTVRSCPCLGWTVRSRPICFVVFLENQGRELLDGRSSRIHLKLQSCPRAEGGDEQAVSRAYFLVELPGCLLCQWQELMCRRFDHIHFSRALVLLSFGRGIITLANFKSSAEVDERTFSRVHFVLDSDLVGALSKAQMFCQN